MTKRNTKKALVVSLLSLLLCCSMLVGTTFAWFTDSVTSGNNKIVAGNLDVELEYLVGGTWKPVTETTNVFEENTLWEPGHTEVVYLKVSNLGTLALDYRLGVNIASEKGSVNVKNESFKLSDYIMMGAIDDRTTAYDTREEARAALNGKYVAKISEGHAKLGALYPVGNVNNPADAKTEEYVALVVYMPEEVGNEANYKTGSNAPEILLGIELFASQQTFEKDSFNDLYDLNNAAGVAEVVPGSNTQVDAWNLDAKHKAMTLDVPAAAVDPAASKITVNVTPDELYENITVAADQKAQTFDVTVTGIAENNTTPIMVNLYAGEDLTGVKLYHYGTEVVGATYSATTGYVTFTTTGFSPFTVVCDAEAQPEIPGTDDSELKAVVENVTDQYKPSYDYQWGNYGAWSPSSQTQQLETVYKFSAPHTAQSVENSIYKNWECDFVVSIDKDIKTGSLFLGGNYGDWGWIGFENPFDVAAGTEVPLLGSVTSNPWTYEQVVKFVEVFTCGVGEADGRTEELDGATFTVVLRLTNPETEEVINAATITYKFPTHVSTSEELQDAINNGSGEIILDGDIDLSQGIVIP